MYRLAKKYELTIILLSMELPLSMKGGFIYLDKISKCTKGVVIHSPETYNLPKCKTPTIIIKSTLKSLKVKKKKDKKSKGKNGKGKFQKNVAGTLTFVVVVSLFAYFVLVRNGSSYLES